MDENYAKEWKIFIIVAVLFAAAALSYLRLAGVLLTDKLLVGTLANEFAMSSNAGLMFKGLLAIGAIKLLTISADKHSFPRFQEAHLYSAGGSLVKHDATQYEAAGKVRIRVFFRKTVSEIYFFMIPQYDNWAELRQEIGHIKLDDPLASDSVGENWAEIVWEVPYKGFTGCVGVQLLNGEEAWYEPNVFYLRSHMTSDKGVYLEEDAASKGGAAYEY